MSTNNVGYFILHMSHSTLNCAVFIPSFYLKVFWSATFLHCRDAPFMSHGWGTGDVHFHTYDTRLYPLFAL